MGFGAVIPPGGAPFPAVGGPSEVEGVARLFWANHRRLSGSPGPPMKLRAGSQGTGELSSVGERNAARFFAASAAPSRGVWGTKLWPFFSRILKEAGLQFGV